MVKRRPHLRDDLRQIDFHRMLLIDPSRLGTTPPLARFPLPMGEGNECASRVHNVSYSIVKQPAFACASARQANAARARLAGFAPRQTSSPVFFIEAPGRPVFP